MGDEQPRCKQPEAHDEQPRACQDPEAHDEQPWACQDPEAHDEQPWDCQDPEALDEQPWDCQDQELEDALQKFEETEFKVQPEHYLMVAKTASKHAQNDCTSKIIE